MKIKVPLDQIESAEDKKRRKGFCKSFLCIKLLNSSVETEE